MTVETSFRAVLAAHAPLVALVGTRIAQDEAPEGSILPLVVFTCNHDRTHGLDGALLLDHATLSVECWANTGAESSDVADAVIAAVATAPVAKGAIVLGRSTAVDQELGLDGVSLTVEWWEA